MPPPHRITEWLRRTYPKPTVDPEWLDACLAWISEELHLDNINSQADEIISNVESQLLNSDLHDSMLAGTGLPLDIGTAENTRLRGNILVQIQGITEIGHSAFSLQNVQQTRMDRADLAGLGGEEEEDEDEGPIPKYPRSMLRFDLTDGSNSVRAIEFRRLPDLELGVTPLGYKVREKGSFIVLPGILGCLIFLFFPK
jgi:RecQ-mediated genome instability protein 1